MKMGWSTYANPLLGSFTVLLENRKNQGREQDGEQIPRGVYMVQTIQREF